MAKFLNTSAANYYLEEIIRAARTRLILLSPALKLNGRLKELLEDKNRLRLNIRIVFGKNELQPDEISWLRGLCCVRISFCENLHAKCYLNEETCLVTSLNLYEFSQVENNEIGVLISRSEEPDLFEQASDEAQRLIRISDEIRLSVERVSAREENVPEEELDNAGAGKLSTSRLARKLGLKTHELTNHLISLGAIEIADGRKQITALGRRLGGELRVSARFGPYFLWPEALPLTKE